MKLTKRKDYTGSIRAAWNDAKTVRIGLIGTVMHRTTAGHSSPPLRTDNLERQSSTTPARLHWLPQVIGGNTK